MVHGREGGGGGGAGVGGDQRRRDVHVVVLPAALERLEVEARDRLAHAALHLLDGGPEERAHGRGEDALGEGEDVWRDAGAQEEEGGLVGEVVAVPAHEIF